jgi:DNA-binding protein HU-beta
MRRDAGDPGLTVVSAPPRPAAGDRRAQERRHFARSMAGTAKLTDVSEYVAKQTGLSNKQSKQAVQASFEAVGKLLKKNDKVSITGVGVFSKTTRPAQKGGKKATNPFTGEAYTTKPKPASVKVKFRAGKGFKSNYS